jgi:hypothetical protein
MFAKRVIADGILTMVNDLLQIRLHFHEFVFGHICAFKHGFLNPGPVSFQDLYYPVPDPVVNNVKADQEKHLMKPLGLRIIGQKACAAGG